MEFIKIYNEYKFGEKDISELWNSLKEIKDSNRNNVLHYAVLSMDFNFISQIKKTIGEEFNHLLLEQNSYGETPLDWILSISNLSIKKKILSLINWRDISKVGKSNGMEILNEQFRKVLIGDDYLYFLSNDVINNIVLKGIKLEPRIKFDYFYLYSKFNKDFFEIDEIDKNKNFNITKGKTKSSSYLNIIIPFLYKNALIYKLPSDKKTVFKKPRYKYSLADFYIVNKNKIKIPSITPILAMMEWINPHIKDTEFYALFLEIIKIYLETHKMIDNSEHLQGNNRFKFKYQLFLESIRSFVLPVLENLNKDELFALLIELLRGRKYYSEYNLLSYELNAFISQLILSKIHKSKKVRFIYPQVNFDFLPFMYYLRNIKKQVTLYLTIENFKSYQICILTKFLSLYNIKIKYLSEINSKEKNKNYGTGYNIILLNFPFYRLGNMDILDKDRRSMIYDFLKDFLKTLLCFSYFTE